MNAESLKKTDSSSIDPQTPSGWDPFTVWRERVHKPRAESKRLATVTAPRDSTTGTLRLLKQGS